MIKEKSVPTKRSFLFNKGQDPSNKIRHILQITKKQSLVSISGAGFQSLVTGNGDAPFRVQIAI